MGEELWSCMLDEEESMNIYKRSRLSLFILLYLVVQGAFAQLRIDFTHSIGPVEPGFQPYFADHEVSASFTEQHYSAFGTTISIKPEWPNNPDARAKQMVQRDSGSDLIIDWIGTDTRIEDADPLKFTINGLPQGIYVWTSYHHDWADQTGLFDVVVMDALGLDKKTGVDISNGDLALEDVTQLEMIIQSNGLDPVVLSFDTQHSDDVSRTFFVMNGFILEVLDAFGEGLPVTGAPGPQAVVISEFVASNRQGKDDGDGNSSDWIELYNGTNAAVSLAGWALTDNDNDLAKWIFPEGTSLPAQEYLVVFASGQSVDNTIDSEGYLHTNFSLNKEGEYLALVDPSGTIVHEYTPNYPEQETDVSYGLLQYEYYYFSRPTPGKPNLQPFRGFARTSHSHERGFYDDPFDLTIVCEAPDAHIRYTLDGSEPSLENGYTYDPHTPVSITTTTHVRSVAYQEGWQSAPVTTHTYIFVDDVAQQPADPPGWPNNWGWEYETGWYWPITEKLPADYEMDPRVVNNTLPGYSIRDALLDIPTVSISMLPEDFITDNEDNGIYSNPVYTEEQGWTRKCSVEYILPDESEGFQEDCEIKIHGNASRYPQRMHKHSLRLTFTSRYGAPKLHYALYPESDVEEFNQLILKAFFTDSWGLVSWSATRYRPNDSQYIRDTWMKESLRAMGHASSDGRFVHLYVNGLYFGLHNLSERVDDDFLAEHLGGEPEDWELHSDFTVEGGEPPIPHWDAMMAIDPTTSAGYQAMQEYLDVENYIDYMLLHFYGDSEDWPHHNGHAAANPVSGDGKYRFFVWDQEISLDGHGRAASRIYNDGGAGAILQKLRVNEEFRLLFADRVYKHCFNGGALSLEASAARYAEIAGRIDKAIVAESARWGDVQMSVPYANSIQQPSPLTNIDHYNYPPAPHGPNYYFTREESWVVERDNVINNYIPAIHDTTNSYALINVLRDADLYPEIDPPVFHINGVDRHGGPVVAGDQLTMINPHGTGTIYYTMDGSDPHVSGDSGVVSSQTLIYEDAPKKVWVPTQNIDWDWTGGHEPYADTSWTHGTPENNSGMGAVGYENDSGYESYITYDVQAHMSNTMESCYIRIPFTVSAADLADFNFLTLRIRYDDGFVAYLNGTRIAATNASASPAWNSGAQDSHSDSEAVVFETIDCSDFVDQLQSGDNILAIHGLNYRTTSSDFLISVELIAGEIYSAVDSISDSALVYSDPLPLTYSTRIKARLWDDGQWSALNDALYIVDPFARASSGPGSGGD
jgi:hypothetical protein